MSMSYTHLLVPTSLAFTPASAQITGFLEEVVVAGAIPPPRRITVQALQEVDPRVLKATNPFTGETLEFSSPSWRGSKPKGIKDLAAIPGAIKGKGAYDIRLEGHGRPEFPLLELYATGEPANAPFKGRYSIILSCCVRPCTVSMCDVHDEAERHGRPDVVPFEAECGPEQRTGLFTHPDTLELIEVRDAGCARFWIAVEYGKWLFPRIKDGNLAIAHPAFMTMARDAFGCDFAQGCVWG